MRFPRPGAETYTFSLVNSSINAGSNFGRAYRGRMQGDSYGDVVGSPAPPAPVPEPGTWALVTVGFGLAGAALRRRNLPLRAANRPVRSTPPRRSTSAAPACAPSRPRPGWTRPARRPTG